MTADDIDTFVCDLIDLALDADGPILLTERRNPELRQEQRALIAALRRTRLAFGLFRDADGAVCLMVWPHVTPTQRPRESGRKGSAIERTPAGR